MAYNIFKKKIQYVRYNRTTEIKYFRIDHINKRVLQLVKFPGTRRQGRNPNQVGIFFVSYNTFTSNYYEKYCFSVSEGEFKKQMNKIIRKFR